MADNQICRFPQGDGPGADWDFCPKNAQKDSVYCPEHHKRCYNGFVTSTRKKKGGMRFMPPKAARNLN